MVRRSVIIAILLTAICPFTQNAFGAEAPNDDVAAFFRVIWALLIVLAIILCLYALFRNRFSMTNPRKGRNIRIIEIQPLMPKKSICLVEVKGREYLLGIGNEDITFLASLDSPGTSSFKEVLDNSKAQQ